MTSVSDIVWYNSSTGETQIWFMNGERLVRRATVVDERGADIFIGPPFSIVGTGTVKPVPAPPAPAPVPGPTAGAKPARF
jgi:hypothetical protein